MKRLWVGFIILIVLSLCGEHSYTREPEPEPDPLSKRVADSLVFFIDQFQNQKLCGTRANADLCKFGNVVKLGNKGIFLNAHSNNIEFKLNSDVTSGLYTSSSKRSPANPLHLLEIQQESSLKGVNRTIWHEFIHHLVELRGSDAYLINLASGGNGTCNGSTCSGAADACGLDEAYTGLLEARHSWLETELKLFEKFDYNPAKLSNLDPGSIDAWIKLKENWEKTEKTGGPGRTSGDIAPYDNYSGLGDGQGSLSGPFTWKDNACSCCSLIWFNKLGAGKSRPYTLNKNMIQALDQAFGMDVDIEKIRPLYADKLNRDKVWQKNIDSRLTNADKKKCYDLASVENQLKPIVALKSNHLTALSRPNAGTKANTILAEAKKMEGEYQKALGLVTNAEAARKKAITAASAANSSKVKIEGASAKAAAIAGLKGQLPNKSGAQNLCAEIIALVNQMNSYIELATKYEGDITPFYDATDQAKKKVCGELKAIAEASPEGANEATVNAATNAVNRASQNSHWAGQSAGQSRQNADSAVTASNNLKIKLERKNAYLKTIAEFRQKLAGKPLLADANAELAIIESGVSTARSAAREAKDAERNVEFGFYAQTCPSSSKAKGLVTKARTEANGAANEEKKAQATLVLGKRYLTSVTEKLTEITNLETLATEIEAILNSCAVPEVKPIEDATAAAERAEIFKTQAHDNWTKTENCANNIKNPIVTEGEEDEEDEEASDDVPDELAEGEVSDDEDSSDTTEVTEETDEEETSDSEEEEGVLDEWAGPWMGTLKAHQIKVNGVTKSSSKIISELEHNYLQNKKKKEEESESERQSERAEDEAEEPSLGRAVEGIQEVPAAVAEVMAGVVGEIIDIILISIVDVTSSGIPIGFSMKKLESGYRIFVPDMPTNNAKHLRSIPKLTLEENGAFHGDSIGSNELIKFDIKLVPNEDKSEIDATLVVIGKNIKQHMPKAKYDSIEIVMKGNLKREEFSYPVLAGELKNRLGPVLNKHMERLNSMTED